MAAMRGGCFSSIPPYFFHHAGPCIVAGSAFCLHDDLAAARARFGADIPVIAVNAAAKEVRALALFSLHPDRLESFGWIRKQRVLFGDDATVHSTVRRKNMPWIDFWWKGAHGCGGSAWCARKMATFMGFSPIILCGCPMEPGPYVGNHCMGGYMDRPRVVDDLFDGIAKDKDWHDGCYSMSGRTMALLGGVSGIE